MTDKKDIWIIGFRDGSGRGEDNEGIWIVRESDEKTIIKGGVDGWGVPMGLTDMKIAQEIILHHNHRDDDTAYRTAVGDLLKVGNSLSEDSSEGYWEENTDTGLMFYVMTHNLHKQIAAALTAVEKLHEVQ